MTVTEQRETAAQQERPDPGRTTVEWITLGISLLIVATVIGLIVYAYVTRGSTPPIIDASAPVDRVRQVQDRYYLPIEVRNSGGQTAKDVRVAISLTTPDGRTETAEVLIDFLAGDETAQATAVFTHDPRQGTVTVGVISYLAP
ncbi:hypothetical protein [Sphaerobacter sp.]|uniref:hypothetical protein n=1 Tax=Sphaerobacter sp. TaxID=2099654 RepID=UPI001D81ECE3|nr:hypothetical protein [Sphaerobacter sp.]MBX5445196.1 TIGR02588 family protein [Sphaerobacter sp.]